MSNSAIQQHNADLRKSITNSFLQKGNLHEALMYDNNFKIGKSGKQIKEALASLKSVMETRKQDSLAKMTKYLKDSGKVPTQKPSSYLFGPYQNKFDITPNMFGWKDCEDSQNKECSPDIVVSENTPSDSSIANCCQNYNRSVRSYINTCVDSFTIDTLTNAFDDKKNYQLTIRQATSLGF